MQEFAATDCWRFFNPSKLEYSFFSPVHRTYTRIDLFLVDNRLLPSISRCRYDAIVLSDHAPLLMDIKFSTLNSERPPWRLNVRLLANENFVSFVSGQIDFFLSTNQTPGVSASLLWESLKAFIRGEIISYIHYEQKLRRDKMNNLRQQILQLDAMYAVSPSPNIYKERLSLQAEFDTLMTYRTTELMLQSSTQFFEHGDKASKLLAHQIRQVSASRQISKIQTPCGVTTEPSQINQTFKEFYETLYTSEATPSDGDLDYFFSTLKITTVDQEDANTLGRTISLSEISTAILSLQAGKCPGPDGYPSEFYKKFIDKLAPLLLDMYNEAYSEGMLPQTLNQAIISLILKKEKDPLSCSSYRPISLLNVDFKILSKILSIRLETILPKIINPDQTGFIRNRHSFSNLRRLFNITYNNSNSNTQEAIISLDAEKAFDRVEWAYLFHTVRRFGLGDNFLCWIKLLYANPLAAVRTNSTQSTYFSLHRSTRQGCPLSPLLFALAIEPLAIAIRNNLNIKGVHRYGVEAKVSLYADDLLLYVSDINRSIPVILSVLSDFRKLSGYKLNLSKSEIFPLDPRINASSLQNFPFKVANDSFLHLGVQVTKKPQDLFGANFIPLLSKTKEDFERWSWLKLSLVARINCVKMNILPRFLYLFQCLPIFLTSSFFSQVDSLVSEFLWDKKNSRLSKHYLQRPKVLGGMALPNFRYYYWASNIRIFKYWLQSRASPTLDWLTMELNSVKPVSLNALLYSPIHFPVREHSKNYIVKTSLKILTQFKRFFGLQIYSHNAPLAANPFFTPSLVDNVFLKWADLGLRTFKDLFIDDVFASFQQLSERFSLPKQHFFRYLQARSFVISTFPSFPNLSETSTMDSLLLPSSSLKGSISLIYNQISAIRSKTLDTIKALWEDDLGETFSDSVWSQILMRVHKSSICARHGLMQCKLVHRVYFTKFRLSKIFPNISPACDRCHQCPGNLIHTFWLCPKLLGYWTEVFSVISRIIERNVSPNPLSALFGIFSGPPSLSKSQKDSLAFM
uniref:Reverse transcriptase domain-containing protein n=1 Tax=Oryzias latipes TaxID=8090 RepID=A0A3B3HW57_ORYLA